MAVFEVFLSKDTDFEAVAKDLLASSGTTTVVLSQPQSARCSFGGAKTLWQAIARKDSIVHLKCVNMGGDYPLDKSHYNAIPDLECFTELLGTVGQRLQSVVFDGGVATVEEGFPVCDGPRGMEEFEQAIEGMTNCEKFELTNFKIVYIGNPALCYFGSPVPMRLDSVLNTIRQLPKLAPEYAANFTVTDRDVELANQMNFNRADEDSALDGFGRSYEYMNGERH